MLHKIFGINENLSHMYLEILSKYLGIRKRIGSQIRYFLVNFYEAQIKIAYINLRSKFNLAIIELL